MRHIAWMAAALALAVAAQSASAEPLSPSLRAFLAARYHLDPAMEKEWPTRVAVAEAKRDDGGYDIVAYISGRDFCGSGGCDFVILEPENGAFRVLGDLTITNTPIVQLPASSHGHPDLAVEVSGGGIQPGYAARLRFDGKTYPDNPSVPPAEPMKGEPKGKVLIGGSIFAENAPDSARGDLLWPNPQ
jgi:hypothetical protein